MAGVNVIILALFLVYISIQLTDYINLYVIYIYAVLVLFLVNSMRTMFSVDYHESKLIKLPV